MKPKLTIGCACYDDVEGFFWTMSIIRQFHVPVINKEVELLCIDDMPVKQKELDHLCNLLQARYVHKPKNMGPAHGKRSVFEEANGEYTLLLDSHVLCAANSINYILSAIQDNRIQRDIWSGPLLNEHGAIIGTELDMNWRGEFFGTWNTDPNIKSSRVKEINGMGSAYFCMNTQQFLDIEGFPKEFKGFGGEELILSEINRQKTGGKHFCHAALGWQHRFYRPRPVAYTLTINDKYKNYLVGFYKCGWDCADVKDYFSRKLPLPQLEINTNEVLAIFPDLFTKTAGGKKFTRLD